MLDLSLALGRMPHEIEALMPLTDLHRFQAYAARRMLPWRRVEMLLAQVSLVLAKVNGDKTSKLDDFLFDPKPQVDGDDDEPGALVLEFNPVNRKKRA